MTTEPEPDPESEPELPTPARDFFADLDSIKVAASTGDLQLLEKPLTMVPVRKPSRESFIRTHPDHWINSMVLELKDENTTLVEATRLQPVLAGESCISLRRLQLAVTANGVAFIWPLRLPNGNRQDTWATTALDAAAMAQEKWVRVSSNMSLGGYQIAVAKTEMEPKWPKESFNDIMRIAFNGSLIESLDHPVLRQLRGEL